MGLIIQLVQLGGPRAVLLPTCFSVNQKKNKENREESRVLKLSVPSIRSRLETASSNALTGIIRQSARMNTVASSSNNAFDAEPYEGRSRVFEQPYIGITSYPIKPGALKEPSNKSHTYKKMEGVHPGYARGNTEERSTIKHLIHAVDLVPPPPKRKSTEPDNETREIDSSTVVEFQKVSKREKNAEFSCGEFRLGLHDGGKPKLRFEARHETPNVLHIKIENQKTEGVMAGDVDFKVSTWMGAAI
ncbi:hypothetical protein N7513_003500 [Penicillium frequentans]|nr:hypothetical protein N7513_003500 [Penicillium glabrum]